MANKEMRRTAVAGIPVGQAVQTAGGPYLSDNGFFRRMNGKTLIEDRDS